MTSSELDDFIWQRRNDDPRQLALAAARHPGVPIPFAAAQVAALQKLRLKIPAWHQPGLRFPLALALEQASSEATARFKASLFSGKNMADLTGGLGADCFFFAQNFETATLIEQNTELLAAAQHNFERLGAANVRFVADEASRFLRRTSEHFDLIYLDPARRDGTGGRVFRLEDCSPNVLEIKDLLLAHAHNVLLKTAPMLDLRLAAEQLRHVRKIWVVASEGDCREVLFGLRADATLPFEQVPISAVSLEKNGAPQAFEFTPDEEKRAHVEFSQPLRCLHEPHASVLKSGAFRAFAARFGLKKLHPHTHLYTSDAPIKGLPARSFWVENVCKYDRKTVAAAVPDGRANIAARNFPDGAEAVRQRLALRDGGAAYLFAATLAGGQRAILVCKKCD